MDAAGIKVMCVIGSIGLIFGLAKKGLNKIAKTPNNSLKQNLLTFKEKNILKA